jgi:predicted nucleotidyltransferase
MNRIVAPEIDEVTAAVLFGSHARGDADEGSDIDICLFTKSLPLDALILVKEQANEFYADPRVAISAYTEPTAESMAREGSLFLWHLRLEGVVLVDKEGFLKRLLASLATYRGYRSELQLYRELLVGVQASFEDRKVLEAVDLHILQMIVRNVSVLFTYAAGQPAFGRKSAFRRARELHPNIPIDWETYNVLCRWHFCYAREEPVPGPLPRALEATNLLRGTDEMLTQAERLLP